ncbi:MAG: hypothetical protein JOZ45_04505 [Acidobacteriaceae bacterium]|nr:hypothetical protein [Acidobacteriaceae bacterium]
MGKSVLRQLLRSLLFIAVTLAILTMDITAGQDSLPTFGTTVVIPSGLQGHVYLIDKDTVQLPDFHTLPSIGTVYTNSLAVTPRNFRQGFPGITRRFEWFAIDYEGRFWIEQSGLYRFRLTSDDGASLYVDEQLIADNDGLHESQTRNASLRLSVGIHRIRISYFQGPRFHVALVLEVAPPGQVFRVFNTEEFKPPPNPEDWPRSPCVNSPP